MNLYNTLECNLQNGRSETWDTFYTLFTLPLRLLVYLGSAFKINYCLQLLVFLVTAGCLISWARESRKVRQRGIKRSICCRKKENTAYSSSIKSFWKSKENLLPWAEYTSLGFMASVLFPAQLCLINDKRKCFMIMMMQRFFGLLRLVIKLCMLRMEKMDQMTNDLIQHNLNLNDFELNIGS